MNNFFTNLKTKTNKISNHFHNGIEALLKHAGFYIMIALVTIIALYVRYALVHHQSGDTYWFLVPWTRYIRDNGGLRSLDEVPVSYWLTSINKNIPYGESTEGYIITGQVNANYPTFYYFLIALFSYLPISELAVIKTISFLFDLAGATAMLLIIYKVLKSKTLALLGFTLTLFVPTAIINSGVWGQSDMVFASMGLWFLYFYLKDKNYIGMVFLGIGLSIKIHMVFILPIVGILFLRRRFNLLNLFIIPIVVLITFIPSYIAGAPFSMPFSQIVNVAGTYSAPNMNSGSIYAFFNGLNGSQSFRNSVSMFGVPLAFLVLLVFTYIFYEAKVVINNQSVIAFATLFSFLTPFLLPHMHERYFYMGDIFIILFAITNPKRWWLIIVSQVASLLTYANFILGGWFFQAIGPTGNMIIAASLNILIISVLTIDILKIKENSPEIVENEDEIAQLYK